MLNECTTYVLKGLHALAQQLLGCLRIMMQSISSQLQRKWLEEKVNEDWIHYIKIPPNSITCIKIELITIKNKYHWDMQ